MKLPCINCISLPICKSLMICDMIDDYWKLVRRCSSIRIYLDYEENRKSYQISAKFFKAQNYLYKGKVPDE